MFALKHQKRITIACYLPILEFKHPGLHVAPVDMVPVECGPFIIRTMASTLHSYGRDPSHGFSTCITLSLFCCDFVSQYLVERSPEDGSYSTCVIDNILRALNNPTCTTGSYPLCNSYIDRGRSSMK